MKTFNRICLRDYFVDNGTAHSLNLKKGREYLTSSEENGKVMVFTTYWAWIPTEIFSEGIEFTK